MELLFDIDKYLDWYKKVTTPPYKEQGGRCHWFNETAVLILNPLQWDIVYKCNKNNKHNQDLDRVLLIAKPDKQTRKTIINNHIKKLQALEITFLDSFQEPRHIPLLNYHKDYMEKYEHLEFNYIVKKTFLKLLKDIGIIRGLDYANQLLEDLSENDFENDFATNTGGLKWRAKPSQLGFIIHELTSQGYIEAPTNKNGEINYSKLARQILESFDSDTPLNQKTISLAVNPNSESGQISGDSKKRFLIPNIKEIS